MLRNNCTLVRNAVEIVKNNNISCFEKEVTEAMNDSSINVLDEEAAWMIVTVLRDDHTLVENAVKIMKSSSITALNEEMIFILDK